MKEHEYLLEMDDVPGLGLKVGVNAEYMPVQLRVELMMIERDGDQWRRLPGPKIKVWPEKCQATVDTVLQAVLGLYQGQAGPGTKITIRGDWFPTQTI